MVHSLTGWLAKDAISRHHRMISTLRRRTTKTLKLQHCKIQMQNNLILRDMTCRLHVKLIAGIKMYSQSLSTSVPVFVVLIYELSNYLLYPETKSMPGVPCVGLNNVVVMNKDYRVLTTIFVRFQIPPNTTNSKGLEKFILVRIWIKAEDVLFKRDELKAHMDPF